VQIPFVQVWRSRTSLKCKSFRKTNRRFEETDNGSTNETCSRHISGCLKGAAGIELSYGKGRGAAPDSRTHSLTREPDQRLQRLPRNARAGIEEDGETDDRLSTVAGWRDAPFFTDEERAALALTEAATRISDRPDPVSDEVWNEAARYYDEEALAQILVHIAGINVWNRLNVATRQVARSEN